LADAEALAQEAEQTKQAVEQDLANSEPLPAGQEMLDSLYA
jgi:F0F1-type ATP synthase membrane subunit b/b'